MPFHENTQISLVSSDLSLPPWEQHRTRQTVGRLRLVGPPACLVCKTLPFDKATTSLERASTAQGSTRGLSGSHKEEVHVCGPSVRVLELWSDTQGGNPVHSALPLARRQGHSSCRVPRGLLGWSMVLK